MRCKLKDAIYVNPREKLPKGTIAKKVAMDKLLPFTRDIPSFEFECYSGGAKFRNGDTIMARITPCLENGKTAKVTILGENEIGFGSTEFIVFRAVPGITDPDYVYYLVCSPLVRDPAIKSMVGTSGRQRVQTDVVAGVELDLPPIDAQQRIGKLMRLIDDQIETNNKINDNLQQQASLIFQAWFEDYFPFGGICPRSWREGSLADIAEISSGKRPPLRVNAKTNKASVPIIGAASVMGFTSEANRNEKILVIGRVGTHGVVQRINTPCWTSDNTLVIKTDYYEYIYQILQRIDYRALNRGSTQPLITQGDLKKTDILIPNESTIAEFETLTGQLMAMYEKNIQENHSLEELRDTLLPRLMSGEIDVSSIQL